MADLPWARRGLVQTLETLALDAEGQVEDMKKFSDLTGDVDPLHNVDEIALQFSDFYLLLPQVLAADMVSAEAATAIDAVDAQLDEMSGEEHAEFWTIDALRKSDQWVKVRELARTALALIQADSA